MPRPTKCHCCEVTDTKEKVKINNKNIHIECVEKYKELLEHKKIENEQWSNLYEYLRQLHNCIMIPPRNIKRLREIKESKNITYELILDAYKCCEDKMSWFISDVLHNGNNAEDINKCITLMLNSGFNEAYRQTQLRLTREREEERESRMAFEQDMSLSIPIPATNKNDELDISDLL